MIFLKGLFGAYYVTVWTAASFFGTNKFQTFTFDQYKFTSLYATCRFAIKKFFWKNICPWTFYNIENGSNYAWNPCVHNLVLYVIKHAIQCRKRQLILWNTYHPWPKSPKYRRYITFDYARFIWLITQQDCDDSQSIRIFEF